MGVADTIPGVSGGTIAFITGIYERLVAAIAELDFRVITRLPGLVTTDSRREFYDLLKEGDYPFLLVLGAGIISAVVTLSHVMAVALATYRAPMNAFFFGLIGASAIVVYRRIDVNTPGRFVTALVGFAFAYWVTGISAGGEFPHSPVLILAGGMLASSAMLLPGISGAALLYIIGQYEFMINTLGSFTAGIAGLITGDGVQPIIEPGIFVWTFLVGVGIGLLTIAHVVRWALATWRMSTITFLVSLMLGSLRLPVIEIEANVGQWTPLTTSIIVCSMILGGVIVLALDYYTDDFEYA